MSEPLLGIRGLHAGYGGGMVLQGVDLDLDRGQAIALLGRNGVGKTTLVHAIMGLLRPLSGSILLDGRELAGRPAHAIAREGVGLVPQGRRVFSRLTVEENLKLGRRSSRGEWTLDAIYELMPRLAERRRHRGDQLSGGEQQMVAIARALLGDPRLMLLDEPSEGLAPAIVDEITATLARLCAGGLSAIVVEQNLGAALELADVVHVMRKGRIVYRATPAEFQSSEATARGLLGVV